MATRATVELSRAHDPSRITSLFKLVCHTLQLRTKIVIFVFIFFLQTKTNL